MNDYKDEETRPFRLQLRDAMAKAGVSQYDLRYELGVHKQQVSDWLNMDRIPRQSTIDKMNHFLGADLKAPDMKLRQIKKLSSKQSVKDLEVCNELSTEFMSFYLNVNKKINEMDNPKLLAKKINNWVQELSELKGLLK